MSTIPNANAIQERQYDTTKSNRRVDVSDAGVRTGAMADLVQKQYETQTKAEVAKAKVSFQVSQAQQNSKYNDDDDEDTIEERYSAGSMEGLGKAAEGITDSALRAQFIMEGEGTVEVGRVKNKALVHQKKGDKSIAYLNDATEVLQKSAIDGTGDLAMHQNSIKLMWESLADQGYVSNESAQKQISGSKYKMALGKLKTMPSDEQLEVLKASWVTDQIPADQVAKLKEEALSEMLNDKALATATDWMGQGLTVEQANAELVKITDSDEYEKTRNRFLQKKNDEEAGTQELQTDLYDTHFADVFFGKTKVNEIPDVEAYQMSDSQLSNLQAAENRATKKAAGEYTPSFSDPATKAELRGMLARDQLQKAKTYFSENFAKLNDSDYKYFKGQTSSSAADPFNKGLRTARQTMTSMIEGSSFKKDDAIQEKIWTNVEDRYNQYFEDNQKKPDGKMVNDWIKDEFIEITTSVGFFWDDDVYVADMSPNQQSDFRTAADALRQRYPNITRDQIVIQYEKLLRGREDRADQEASPDAEPAIDPNRSMPQSLGLNIPGVN